MSTVLIVDDSRVMLKLIGRVLEDAGHRVVQADCGVEALVSLEQTDVDLVITDVNMPGMSGIGLLCELRKRESTRLTPIFLLTSEDDLEVKKRAKESGATGWINKPIDTAQLVATVQKVLE